MPSVPEVLSSCLLRSAGCRDPYLRGCWLSLCGHVLEAAGQKTCHSFFCSSTSPCCAVFYCSCSKLSCVLLFPWPSQMGESGCRLAVVRSGCCQLDYCFLHIVRCKMCHKQGSWLVWNKDSIRTYNESEGKGSTSIFPSSSVTIRFLCVCFILLKTESEKIIYSSKTSFSVWKLNIFFLVLDDDESWPDYVDLGYLSKIDVSQAVGICIFVWAAGTQY